MPVVQRAANQIRPGERDGARSGLSAGMPRPRAGDPGRRRSAPVLSELAPATERQWLDQLHASQALAPRLHDEIAQEIRQRLIGWQRAGMPLTRAAADSLFIACLHRLQFWDVPTELALTGLRQALLEAADSQTAPDEALRALYLGMIVQAGKTGFAWFANRRERQALAQIETLINGALAEPRPDLPALLPGLLALLMYRSPAELACADRLAGPDFAGSWPPLADFLQGFRAQQSEEQRLGAEFAAQSRPGDAVSKSVAQMYERAPYPRYLGDIPVNINPAGLSYVELAGLADSPVFRDTPPGPQTDALVAGCGTGLHPIKLAEGFPWLQVTAIDIAARSLAYAQLAAEQRGLANLHFRRQDILDLDPAVQFDLIEAIGVLHHMGEPEAGLRRLLDCLRPRGLLKLGLYSRRGRQAVRRFRELHPARSNALDDDAVREIRHKLLRLPAGNELRQLTRYRDFYSLNGVRDLLLHEQERQYSLPELQDVLERHGLAFLGFANRDNAYRRMLGVCGPGADPLELRNWANAEEAIPDLFAGMYVFFACRRADFD